MVRCHMDSLTSTGESVEGETSWEYVEGEEEEEEGDDWEYEEVEEEPEVPRREVLRNFFFPSQIFRKAFPTCCLPEHAARKHWP